VSSSLILALAADFLVFAFLPLGAFADPVVFLPGSPVAGVLGVVNFNFVVVLGVLVGCGKRNDPY